MTSSHKKVMNPDAPAKKANKGVGTRAKRVDPSVAMWTLFPSAEQLKQVVAGVATYTSAQPDGRAGDHTPSLDVPRSLLNPLESLPRPLSLDDVKERLRATAAASIKQAE